MLRILQTAALSALAIVGTSVLAEHHGHHGKKGHHSEGHMHKNFKGKFYGTIETDIAGIFRGTTTETEATAAFGSGIREEKETFTPNLAISYGYFLTNQLALRAGLQLAFGKTEVEQTGQPTTELETSEIGFALGVNYSFIKHVCKSPYIEASFIYAIDEEEGGAMDRKSNLFGGQVSLGYRVPLGSGGATWSPSFDYRYLSGDTETQFLPGNPDFDTNQNQWTVNLVKFDYFF